MKAAKWGEIQGNILQQNDIVNLVAKNKNSNDWATITGDIASNPSVVRFISSYFDEGKFIGSASTPYNKYHIIRLGSQDWGHNDIYAEKYNNGTAILNPKNVNMELEDNVDSINTRCFWPSYDSDYIFNENVVYPDVTRMDIVNENSRSNTSSILYTYYALKDVRSVCPTGYRIAQMADWVKLLQHLGEFTTPIVLDVDYCGRYHYSSSTVEYGTINHAHQLAIDKLFLKQGIENGLMMSNCDERANLFLHDNYIRKYTGRSSDGYGEERVIGSKDERKTACYWCGDDVSGGEGIMLEVGLLLDALPIDFRFAGQYFFKFTKADKRFGMPARFVKNNDITI